MIKLIESKLFGHKLFLVERPLMVKRYNDCLEAIGVASTKLEKFHIDGLGWSPEIANEKDDRLYLTHSIANPFAIIISPQQKDCALYMPYHSFDWEIHSRVFRNYAMQIKDVTAQEGLWFEMDQNITVYQSAQDLLMMDVMNIKFSVIGNLQQAALEQKQLVSEYSNNPRGWFDETLMDKIVESSTEHGDLRYRNLQLPDLPMTNISCYYTAAFGGLYVFRSPNLEKPIIIFNDNSSEKSGDMKFGHLEFNLNDPALIAFLLKVDLLDDDPIYYRGFMELLEQQLDYMLTKSAVKLDPESPVDRMTKTQKKGLIGRLNEQCLLDEKYAELGKIIVLIKNGSASKEDVAVEIELSVLHPKPGTTKEEKSVLWQLIAKIQNNNPVLNYTFDKPAFYEAYQTWEEPMRRWAIGFIVKNIDLYAKLLN